MPEMKEKKKGIKVFTKKKKANSSENEYIKQLQAKYEENIDLKSVKSFNEFPLSPKTLKGLKDSGYKNPTEIQKETLLLALSGKDILGAAQTGSGKTLAFLIPILEKLFCNQWTHLDGLGGLVITPTRELAYQIFETLRRIGSHHDFSAGLIIGGKDLKFERSRMDQCNIIICTPGRLLQHMDENPLFDAVNLKILVLDEADRCLDMGFEQTMNAIIANLPLKRQTLLFSATQTKSVKDLARLSLKDPSYVAVHENAKHSTPPGLQQSYVVCELKDKVSILWSFIKNHLKQKCIIFMSSCKQVKYIFEIFSKLRPGTSLMALYGTLHQLRRMEIYESFSRKSSAILFATDLAARGLDFPEVHWVVQMDCPEDSATYVHRVGRTARYHKGGESLLMLLPSELAMLKELETRKIPIEKIDINPAKLNNPVRKMEAYLVSSPALKETAKRAFVAYAKSVSLMQNKEVFNVEALDTDSFAHSLGLAIPPRIRFLQRRLNSKNKISFSNKKNVSDEKIIPATLKKEIKEIHIPENVDSNIPEEIHQNDDIEDDEEEEEEKTFVDSSRVTISKHKFDVDGDSDDEIFSVKRRHHDIEIPENINFEETDRTRKVSKKPITKAALVKKILKKNIVANKKTTFDETGEAIPLSTKEKKSELAQEYENEDLGGINIEKAKLVLREEDKFDKQLFKEKVKAKHKETKRKLKEKKLKEKEEFDDFSEEEFDEPDLSWLPDPDKVYGTSEEKEEVEDLNQSKDDFIPSISQSKKSKKMKRKSSEGSEPPNKKYKKKVEKLNSNLSVNEAEELALMLMRKK